MSRNTMMRTIAKPLRDLATKTQPDSRQTGKQKHKRYGERMQADVDTSVE